MTPLPWDALLFDFDGVLADTEPLHWACWRDILRRFGLDLTWETFERECVGQADREFIQRLGLQRTPPIPFDELWAAYPAKQELFIERLIAEIPFAEPTVGLVRNLSRSFRLAVVSSSSRAEVEAGLAAAGILDCFHASVCGKREVERVKPAPDPYLKAAHLLSSSKPLVIEDSDAGVASGLAAGFEVLRISHVASVASEIERYLSEAADRNREGNRADVILGEGVGGAG